jgi:hypothetical protein
LNICYQYLLTQNITQECLREGKSTKECILLLFNNYYLHVNVFFTDWNNTLIVSYNENTCLCRKIHEVKRNLLKYSRTMIGFNRKHSLRRKEWFEELKIQTDFIWGSIYCQIQYSHHFITILILIMHIRYYVLSRMKAVLKGIFSQVNWNNMRVYI